MIMFFIIIIIFKFLLNPSHGLEYIFFTNWQTQLTSIDNGKVLNTQRLSHMQTLHLVSTFSKDAETGQHIRAGAQIKDQQESFVIIVTL